MKDNVRSVLKVENLVKHYPTSAGTVRAVDDVSFTVKAGETLGVVGESGCGKSSLGRTLVRLLEPDSGRIQFLDQDITHASRGALRAVRREIQMVFQDPYASLNPRRTVRQILAEPFDVHGIGSRAQRTAQVSELL